MQNVTRTDEGFTLDITVNKFFTVCGDGLWSNTAKEVFVESIAMFINAEQDVYSDGTTDGSYCDGDLQVYFTEAAWNSEELGLIYTDTAFLECVQTELIKAGISIEAAEDVNYSEQGMQGDNYVSCDAYALGDYVRTRMGVTAYTKEAQ
jgi:hypothetical protein